MNDEVLYGARLRLIISEYILPKLEAISGPLTQECTDQIIRASTLRKLRKNQYIEESCPYEGMQLNYLYSGIAYSYYFDTEVKKTIVTRIWKKGDVIFDVNSFVNSEHTNQNTQMLDQGEVISVGYYQIKDLLHKNPSLYRQLVYIGIEREKFNMLYQHLLKLPIEERVTLYLKQNPAQLTKVDINITARYLNITPPQFNAIYKKHISVTEH